MNHMPNSQEARDIAFHMHSYTNAIAHEEIGPMIMERGEGIHVFDNNGVIPILLQNPNVLV